MHASLIFVNICAKRSLITQLTIILFNINDRLSLFAEVRLSVISRNSFLHQYELDQGLTWLRGRCWYLLVYGLKYLVLIKENAY